MADNDFKKVEKGVYELKASVSLDIQRGSSEIFQKQKKVANSTFSILFLFVKTYIF
jgi:hypothetical protein